MTIAIGAAGPRAGAGVFAALRAAEAVGKGSIGGFAAFAVLDAKGELHRAETFRGGSATLFIDAETTGVAPPEAIAEAPAACVISSGPDRPAPLSDFVAGRPGLGLVTGHRLPNGMAASGLRLNEDALCRIERGDGVDAAIGGALADNPDADVGLIAVALGEAAGSVASGNSARVLQRPDLGHARAASEDGAAAVEVLLNAIAPRNSLAALAAEIAFDIMTGGVPAAGEIVVAAGTPVVRGKADVVIVNGASRAMRIETTDPLILKGRWNCAAIYLGAEVRASEGLLGRTLFEPNVVVEDGRVVSINGQKEIRVRYG